MCNKIKIPNKDARSVSSFILPPSSFPRAFTLVELMVSVAIVVILMVGVAQVFQMTSQAVGASQQLSDAVRNERAINSTMGPELAQIATDGPILMIRGAVIPAFRNRADNQADTDGNPATWEQRAADLGVIPTVFPASPNERMHRVDRLGFMARGKFNRQTGNDGVFVAPQSSNEAFVWYGHLCLPHTNGNFYLGGATSGTKTNPGAGGFATNPQNYYATSWTLGHVVTNLIQPTNVTAALPGVILVGSGASAVSQEFIYRTVANNNPQPENMTPLSWQADATKYTGTANFSSLDCRYDLAGTSISGFGSIMRGNLGTQWQEGVSYSAPARVYHNGYVYSAIGANVVSTAANAPVPHQTAGSWTYEPNYSDWWTDVFMSVRYECNPFVVKPLTSATFSQQAPVFAQGCTQFIVEYAGDFLRQDTDPASPSYGYALDSFDNPGAPAAGYAHTDGETDFIVTWSDADGDGVIDASEAGTVHREVRWYGLPRDTAAQSADFSSRPGGDSVVAGFAAGRRPQGLPDVVPFRDVALTIRTTAQLSGTLGIAPALFPANVLTFYNPSAAIPYEGAPFERFYNQAGAAVALKPFYMNVNSDPTNAAGLQENEFYQCAWGPYDTVRPRMIRITITLDDPLSRFAEGQTFEYVFKLP